MLLNFSYFHSYFGTVKYAVFMRIALLGYGRMGKEVETLAIERGHEIVLIIEKENAEDLTAENLSKADVAIDFSLPEIAYEHISICFDAHIPVVTGTTGWQDKMEEVYKRAQKEKQTFLYASNFSLGVNLFFAMSEKLAKMMADLSMYNPSITETHHVHKQDAPSGTAITLAETVLPHISDKEGWSLDRMNGNTLSVKASREGEVPGNHQLLYDSEFDTLKLEHNAKSRKGFALGALLAAEYVQNKKGIFTMKQVLNIE